MTRIDMLAQRYIEAKVTGNRGELLLIEAQMKDLSTREERLCHVKINQYGSGNPKVILLGSKRSWLR